MISSNPLNSPSPKSLNLKPLNPVGPGVLHTFSPDLSLQRFSSGGGAQNPSMLQLLRLDHGTFSSSPPPGDATLKLAVGSDKNYL